MKQNLTITIFLILVKLLLVSNNVFSLSGLKIIENADSYRTFNWICNTRNARVENRDNKWETTNSLYPFIAKGEPIGPDPDGPEGPLPAPTSTGEYTGVAYAWGVREMAEIKKHWRENK
jgi:hypothetical protein